MSYEKPLRNRSVLVVCQAGTKLAIPIPRATCTERPTSMFARVSTVDDERCIVLPLDGTTGEIACSLESGRPRPDDIVLAICRSGQWYACQLRRQGEN